MLCSSQVCKCFTENTEDCVKRSLRVGSHHLESNSIDTWKLDRLLDGDFLRLEATGLGDDDGQDPILQASLDILRIHAGWEGPCAGEAAIRSFRQPVLGVVVGWLRGILRWFLGYGITSLGGSGCWSSGSWSRRFFRAILDGSIELGGRRGLIGLRSSRDLSGFGWFGLAGPIGMAAYRESLAIIPLDVDIIAGDTREVSMELIGVLRFADVEPWLERADALRRSREAMACRSDSVVVEHPEKRGELLERSEEGHVDRRWVGMDVSRSNGSRKLLRESADLRS